MTFQRLAATNNARKIILHPILAKKILPGQLSQTMSGASLGGLDPASLDPASLGGLDPAGWKCSKHGEIKNGEPRCKEEESHACFKHSQSLEAEDVLRMKVVAGEDAFVGIAAEGYDVERDGETYKSTTVVDLGDGTTFISSDISEDGEEHLHHRHLKDYIPKTLPFDLTWLCAVIEAVSNVPQIQFNDDAVWQDFAPDRTALKAGP